MSHVNGDRGAEIYKAAPLSPELLQQCFGLLEVRGVKALGEPAVDRRQQLVGLDTLVLLLPQVRQTVNGIAKWH